jgi:hypothetical protein
MKAVQVKLPTKIFFRKKRKKDFVRVKKVVIFAATFA